MNPKMKSLKDQKNMMMKFHLRANLMIQFQSIQRNPEDRDDMIKVKEIKVPKVKF